MFSLLCGTRVLPTRYVDSMNRRALTYKLKLNHLADLDKAELKRMRGYRYGGVREGELYAPKVSAADMPTSVNWWLYGMQVHALYIHTNTIA